MLPWPGNVREMLGGPMGPLCKRTQRQTARDAAAAKNSVLNPQATDESLAEKRRALQHRMRSQLT